MFQILKYPSLAAGLNSLQKKKRILALNLAIQG